MKKYFLHLTLLLSLLTSCGTSKGISAEVVRDCTGVYVRVDNKDYFVCNKSALVDKENGAQVNIKMEEDQADNCEGKNDIVCMMYHEHKGVVKVKLFD